MFLSFVFSAVPPCHSEQMLWNFDKLCQSVPASMTGTAGVWLACRNGYDEHSYCTSPTFDLNVDFECWSFEVNVIGFCLSCTFNPKSVSEVGFNSLSIMRVNWVCPEIQ